MDTNRMQQEINAVLFDLDGVVIDSNAEIKLFWKKWADQENVPFDNDIVSKFILGRTIQETLDAVFPLSAPEVKQDIQAAARVFDRAMRPQLLKGLDAFLSQLSELALPVGLVTSSPAERVK